MMRPMSSVFSEHQLLHCQTNADVRKGGRGLIKCGHLRTGGGEVGKGVFLWTFFMDDPIISSLCGGRPVWVESAVFWRMPAIFVERDASNFCGERSQKGGRSERTSKKSI